MTTVYKVVRRRRDGKLASAMMSDSKLEVIYKPSKKAHSLNGMKLLALKTEADAWFFRGDNSRPGEELQVWQARATNPHDQTILCSDWTWEGFKEFWALADPLDGPCMAAPPGTVACDSITLIKRVDGAE